jgi:hypothetical protein
MDRWQDRPDRSTGPGAAGCAVQRRLADRVLPLPRLPDLRG